MRSFFITLCRLPAALGPVKVRKKGSTNTYLIESLVGVLTLDLVADDEVTLDFQLAAKVQHPALLEAVVSLSFPHPFGLLNYLEKSLSDLKKVNFRYPVDKAMAQRLRESYEAAYSIVQDFAKDVAKRHAAR